MPAQNPPYIVAIGEPSQGVKFNQTGWAASGPAGFSGYTTLKWIKIRSAPANGLTEKINEGRFRMPSHNADIAAIFEEIADLLEIEGANPFRIRAYRNAARTIGDLS